MSILEQFPRRFSRPVPAVAVPGSTAEAGPQDLAPAVPGSWPWRRAALLAVVVLVTGMAGQATQTGSFFLFSLPALAAMIVAAGRLWREGA